MKFKLLLRSFKIRLQRMETPDEFNERCVAELKAAGFQNRVAVIGSGPSLGVRSPTGAAICSVNELIAKLSRCCKIEAIEGEDTWLTAERAFNANAAEYHLAIEGAFATPPQNVAGAYLNLLAIGFRGFVTLNYDNQLPLLFHFKYSDDSKKRFQSYPSRNGDARSLFQAADFGGSKPILQALHGYCEETNPDWHKQIILKKSDYQLHYFDPGRGQVLYNWWVNMVAMHQCVFIGTSLREPGLWHVINRLTDSAREKLEQKDHLHLMDIGDLKKAEGLKEEKTLGVFRRVLFHRIDNDFTGLNKVLLPFTNHRTMTPIASVPEIPDIGSENSTNFR